MIKLNENGQLVNDHGTEVIDALKREEPKGTPLSFEDRSKIEKRIELLKFGLDEWIFNPSLQTKENESILKAVEAALCCTSNERIFFYKKVFGKGHFIKGPLEDVVQERLYSKLTKQFNEKFSAIQNLDELILKLKDVVIRMMNLVSVGKIDRRFVFQINNVVEKYPIQERPKDLKSDVVKVGKDLFSPNNQEGQI